MSVRLREARRGTEASTWHRGSTTEAMRSSPALRESPGMVMQNCYADPGWEDDVLLHIRMYVRPAFRPCRWAWYVVDCKSGEIVEQSFEYDSPPAARRAGLERLEELALYLRKSPRGEAAVPRLRSRRTIAAGVTGRSHSGGNAVSRIVMRRAGGGH
jgi:hypothetical protein